MILKLNNVKLVRVKDNISFFNDLFENDIVCVTRCGVSHFQFFYIER